MDKCIYHNLTRFVGCFCTIDFSLVNGIHKHTYLLEPVLKAYGKILVIESALVGISQYHTSDGIVIGNKDGSTSWTVKDIIAAFMSIGTQFELKPSCTQARAWRRRIEELGSSITSLFFIERICIKCTYKKEERQECQNP